MINPLRRVLIDGDQYNFTPGSFKESVRLKNSADQTQNSKTFTGQGKATEAFTVTLAIEDTYSIRGGSMGTSMWLGGAGDTTWRGVSRLFHLKRSVGGKGVSLPIKFVTPYGATFDVVPVGTLDISVFNPENPRTAGVEFRVSLTLEST